MQSLLDDFPLPLLTLPFLHAAWDGLLLVTGRRLGQLLCPKPHLAKFNYLQLGVLVLWGNLQEITVEHAETGSMIPCNQVVLTLYYYQPSYIIHELQNS